MDMDMDIRTKKDLENAAGEMHDSEFCENDFSFDPVKRIFYLDSFSPEIPGKKFHLEFYNVEEYNPINLEKIKKMQATGGVFNNILFKENNHELTILSQDLKIILRLKSLDGKFVKT
jgi:hypothetical protein